MALPRRVLVLGGSGLFGSRLVRLLQRLQACPGYDVEVLAASRHLPRGNTSGTLRTVRLDVHATDFPSQLCALKPDVVVNAVGPFQGQDFRLAEAAVASGAHYVDIADGREYICASAMATKLDSSARTASRSVVCGASTVPALSVAAVDLLVGLGGGLHVIRAIDTLITPGNRAPRGLSTISAILSYVGRPVPWREGGEWRTVPGWSQLCRRRLSLVREEDVVGRGMPSGSPDSLPPRWFSACDVPDLTLLPLRYPTVSRASFRAGLEVPLLHLGLWLLSLPVRANIVKSLQPAARLLQWGADLTYGLGTDRGGMRVTVTGWTTRGLHAPVASAEGCPSPSPAWVCGRTGVPMLPVRRVWTLLAEGGDGPYIPILAAAAVVARLLHGEPAASGGTGGGVAPGAGPCVGMLSVDEIMAQASVLADEGASVPLQPVAAATVNPPSAVRAATRPLALRCTTVEYLPLYPRVMSGAAYDRLPAAVRRLHDVADALAWSGEARIRGADSWIGGCVAWVLGLPQPPRSSPRDAAVPTTLDLVIECSDEGEERWTRKFGAKARSGAASPRSLAAVFSTVQRFGMRPSNSGGSEASPVILESVWGGLVTLVLRPSVHVPSGADSDAPSHELPQPELRLSLVGATLFWDALRVPRVFLPVLEASERAAVTSEAAAGVTRGASAPVAAAPRPLFHFDVTVSLPLGLGRIVSYAGWLAPCPGDWDAGGAIREALPMMAGAT